MNYYVQINDESPVFKGTLEQCMSYREECCRCAKVVSEEELYIENN